MSWSPETRAIHAGEDREPGAPSAPPIVAASFYLSEGDPSNQPLTYARDQNPTWQALEAVLGSLEQAEAVAFASGQAAALALILALTEGRPRLVLPSEGYYKIRFLAELLAGRGVEPLVLPMGDRGAISAAVSAMPSVLWVETPSNPLLRVADLSELGDLARTTDTPLVVDNTVATPILQQPLDWGATATLTSLTKAASGHSDVVLGSVATRDARLAAQIRTWRSAGGGIPGPLSAWLALRGIRTLPLRLARQSQSAQTLARWLTLHPAIRQVFYPGLAGEAEAALVRRQMPGGGGPLLSFEVDGGAEAADAVVARARLIRPGTSFGGVESSWERRARWPLESAPPGLIRLSVGLEAEADLLEDLRRALAAVA